MKKILCLLFIIIGLQSGAVWAVKPIKLASAKGDILFVEDQNDGNSFITPLSALDPRLTGAEKWTSRRWISGGFKLGEQISLGYMADYGHVTMLNNNNLDIWLDSSPVVHPFLGARCLLGYDQYCPADTSFYPPTYTDDKGFYHATMPSVYVATRYNHALLSANIYNYIRQLPIGGTLSVIYNSCFTSKPYNPPQTFCRDLPSSATWYQRQETWTKRGHLLLKDTHAMSDVFISPSGMPFLRHGSQFCYITKDNELVCQLVNYELNDNNSSGAGASLIFIKLLAKTDRIGFIPAAKDLQISLDGISNWSSYAESPILASSGISYKNLKKGNKIYVKFSQTFFQKLIQYNRTVENQPIDTSNFLSFLLYNPVTPESGYYEFIPSSDIIVAPTNYSLSIISTLGVEHPHLDGVVDKNSPPLVFSYYITTSSNKSSADKLIVQVKGPTGTLNHKTYCLFSSDDKSIQVPFLAYLQYINNNGKTLKKDVDCSASNAYDLSDMSWSIEPWQDANLNKGIFSKSVLSLVFPMNSNISMKTLNNKSWQGIVSAQGEIKLTAIWKTGK